MFDPITLPFGAKMLFNTVKLKPGVTFEQVELAAQLDAELFSHRARTTVATHQVRCADRAGRAIGVFHASAHPGGVLRKRFELTSVAQAHRGQLLGDGLQQRLQRVLRDELVRFQRQAAVVASTNLGARAVY